ncbi:hypothetical protein [Plantibacter flavus]|uniref:hypothetical protein n=1 Tax=Plantibacter flavus TaxID=150123 RepID=UPI001431D4CB|nr:hypothetical protein [Plantibacter flavus]
MVVHHELDRPLARRRRRHVHRVGRATDSHGPVRVDGFHFAHADGTRHRPLGTTAYAWTHQPEELQEQTLRALEAAPFTKIRMCVFPKSYLYNANEPETFPFVGSLADGFDHERFDPAYWANDGDANRLPIAAPCARPWPTMPPNAG